MVQKQGFTLIEIVVAIVIVGLMAAIALPRLRPRPANKRKEFISQLNVLVGQAWYNALVQRKISKITINTKSQQVVLEIQKNQSSNQLSFEPAKGKYLPRTMKFPPNYEIKELIIDGVVDSNVTECWFVIMPDGLAQAVILNMIDKNDKSSGGQPKQFSLVLNPFSAQFTTYDVFQKQ